MSKFYKPWTPREHEGKTNGNNTKYDWLFVIVLLIALFFCVNGSTYTRALK